MADAPGEPGQPPRWEPIGKSGIGRSLRDDSRVWFTLGNGILNEIAYPRIEQTSVRDFGLIVTDGGSLFAEERRHCVSTIEPLHPGVPAYRLTGTHEGGRFRLHKRIIADPRRPAVLQHVRLEDLAPTGPDGTANPPLRLFALLAPHLVNVTGMGTAWVGDYKGQEMLFAEAQGTAVALAASCGWSARSAGYAGISDGWQDLSRHGQMTWQYERAINGNVALTGELDLEGSGQELVISLAFGRIWTEAAMRARAGLLDRFDELEAEYVASWSGWLAGTGLIGSSPGDGVRGDGDAAGSSAAGYHTSLMVIRTHECPSVPGARIASLGVPWAALQNSDYPAACHLVRARDVVAATTALLAAGDTAAVLEALLYLHTVQEPDGHWPQNFWLDGMPAWQGLQLDETAQPVLLADLARRQGLLGDAEFSQVWPMVRAAGLALARHDPLAGQDRWGRSDGLKLHTLGTQVVALLAAADWAGRAAEPDLQQFLQDTADAVRDVVESLLDELCLEPGPAEADPDIVSLAVLGVLGVEDPRLARALAAIDAALRVDLPGGPGWCVRGDEGLAPRPVLTAERATLAVLAGQHAEARALLASFEACAGEGGMLPERVDNEGGRGGMVMPHLWTHAEHVKLLRSIADGRSFCALPHARARYAGTDTPTRIARWRHDHELREMPAGRVLRVELPVAADLHWSDDGWVRIQDTPVVPVGLGIFVAELPTAALVPGARVVFTWRDRNSGSWLGVDHHIAVVERTNLS
ncbi:glycoside hydrolase family 15 protein [Lichenicola sp.]|uniref:glycoside hydrolase family 15 protein n=1 Tax=Lichenicola sp. TaxID=2804529 RepID=UPI003AFF7BEE